MLRNRGKSGTPSAFRTGMLTLGTSIMRRPTPRRRMARIAAALALFFGASFFGGTAGAANGDADRQLEAGIHREMVMGDLPGAMQLYRGILNDPSTPRSIAARALLQLGACLEKLSQSEEAYNKYQRLVSDYPDQIPELTQARLRLAAWSSPRNLKFEEGIPGRVPPGWRVPALAEDSGRLAELRREGCRSRVGCAVVIAAANVPRSEGTLMQRFRAAAYRGKTVRLRAWIKLQSAFIDGPTLRLPMPEDRAQLWMKVERSNKRIGFADNMDDRPVRSPEWTRCEIVGEIDEDAEFINFGVMSIGGGRVWIDDVSFEVVPSTEAGGARGPMP
jgi:tetratricopeptide (TPR) repeat protein